MARARLFLVPKPPPGTEPASPAHVVYLRWRSVSVKLLPDDLELGRSALKELASEVGAMVRVMEARPGDAVVREACATLRTALLGAGPLLDRNPELGPLREARRLLHRGLASVHERVAPGASLGAEVLGRAPSGVTGSAALVLAAGRAAPRDWEWVLAVARIELAHYLRPGGRAPSNPPLEKQIGALMAEIERWAEGDRSEELGIFLAESLLAILEYG